MYQLILALAVVTATALAWHVGEDPAARSCWLDLHPGNWFVVLQHRAHCILSGLIATQLGLATGLVQ
jgi:hypothetical protein